MRSNYYDVLKAIAIIAVVLYHLGTCEYGYLGVDIFLVIAGFLTSKSIDKQIITNGGGIVPTSASGYLGCGRCSLLQLS